MGNCLSILQECTNVMRNRNKKAFQTKDHDEVLKKRILFLEEQAAEQNQDIKMLKTQLSHLATRRLADKRKINSLGLSIRNKEIKDVASFQEMEHRIHEIEEIMKDIRFKIEAHSTMLRELNNVQHHEDEGWLINVLERGIKEGKKHLENLEELFDPVRLVMDSDNSLRQLMQDGKYTPKKKHVQNKKTLRKKDNLQTF